MLLFVRIGLLYKNELVKDDTNGDTLGMAKTHFEKSVQCYNELFDSLKDEDEFKVSIFDQFIQVYKALSDLHIKTKQTNEALLVCERGRGRALEELLAKKYSVASTITETTTSLQLNLDDFQTALQPF